MSITVNQALSNVANVRYTPYRGASRRGAVGTLQGLSQGTGDASGGGVTINFTTVGQEFGFPWLLALTVVGTQDTLVTLENVRFQMIGANISQGNARIVQTMAFVIVPEVAVVTNIGSLEGSLPAIEVNGSDILQGDAIFNFTWTSNVLAKVYKASFFGVMYDLQAMVRVKDIILDGPILGAR